MNGFDYQICQKCGYPLSQDALNRMQDDDAKKIKDMMDEKLLLKTFNNFIDKVMEKLWKASSSSKRNCI